MIIGRLLAWWRFNTRRVWSSGGMVVVDSQVVFPLMNVFAFYLYHGHDYRPDVVYPSSPAHFMGDVISTRLHFERTSAYFPPICLPGTCLIINDQAKAQVHALPNIGFAECIVSRLANVPFDPEHNGRIAFDNVSFDVSP